MFRIEQNGTISLGRPKPPTKGGSASDEEKDIVHLFGFTIEINLIYVN